MNADSANNNRAGGQSAVIKPWLAAGMIVALAGNVLLSAVLIVKLGRFDDSKRQADEAEARVAAQRTELAKLQVEVETLAKQKDALAPTVVEYEKRLREMREAQATAESLNAKQRQSESDIAQATKRLDDANRALLDADKQKAELTQTVERLKAERDALTKSNTDAKVLARQAEEAERRLSAATNALANTDTRRKQLETDASAAQARFEQIQKEADDLRQAREKLTTDLAALRQQIQTQKDLLATFDQKAADLKALQTATGLEEQKAAKLQQQSATAEARAAEMESKFSKAASELSQLTNRLSQARKDTADAETRLETSRAASLRADADLAAAQKRLTETQTSQDQLASEQTKTVTQLAASKKDLEQARKDAADAETRRDAAKADAQKADAELAAARAQLQVFIVKQGELTREASRLDATIERLKKEKEALEKEIGRQEAQRQKNPSEGQK